MLFILIPGLILVALMIYASTRIKKTAALAFEAETIETDEFVIKKPEGFLNVIGGDPQYAFEAYSKNFGTAPAEEIRQGTATLKVLSGVAIDDAVADLALAADETISDVSEMVNEQRYRSIEATRSEKGTPQRVFSRLAEKNGKLYQLEIRALADTTPEFMRDIQAILTSFEIR
jgi:hypothetical protein